jgi:hypothetical protein
MDTIIIFWINLLNFYDGFLLEMKIDIMLVTFILILLFFFFSEKVILESLYLQEEIVIYHIFYMHNSKLM